MRTVVGSQGINDSRGHDISLFSGYKTKQENAWGGQKLQRGCNKRLFSDCFLWDLTSLKRKGGAERRTSVICELQIERVPLKRGTVVSGRSDNSIVQEVGSLIWL